MQKMLAWWESHTAPSAPLRFLDASLRGVGQVMFQNNPLSGLLFFVAIGWGSFAAGMPEVAIGGLIALVTATLTAHWLDVDAADIGAGLYGFNGYLVGLALPTFMAPSASLWLYVAFGGAVSTVAMLAIVNLVKPYAVPALTAPFVLVAWLMLLGTYAFAGFDGGGLPAATTIVALDPAAANPLNAGEFAQAMVRSISQVFLKGDAIAAVLLLAGLAVSSLACAAWAVLGAFVAVLTAHLMGAESDLITNGLMGFSPVLTAIALGAVFHAPGWRSGAYALAATVFTVIVQGAFNMALSPFAIPTLTGPFVLVTWLFLLPQRKFT